MDMKVTGTQLRVKKPLATLSAIALLGLSSSLYAASPTTGNLLVVNFAGIVASGSSGASASPIKVVVNDATGACSTTTSLVYGGNILVKWDSTKTHSSTQCTDITSVDITPLKTGSGLVQYDSTANATPPAVATAATNFVAPTAATSNLALVVTGGASAATTGSATVWGSALGVAPIYAATNGLIATTGILGSVSAEGLKAAQMMEQYGFKPAK